ncbi:MAG: hypothetical protein ABIF11_08585 [Nitrospirota bacterium]
MRKRIFLGLVVVLVCVGYYSLVSFAQDKEEILSLVYQRPYPEMEKTKALKEEVEYSPLFLEEAEFTAKEMPALSKFMTKSKKQSVSICYPKVVLLKKGEEGIGKVPECELLFLDKFGKITKRYPIDWEDVFWLCWFTGNRTFSFKKMRIF